MPTGYARRATFRGLIGRVDAQQKLDVMLLTGAEFWRTGYSLTLVKQTKQTKLGNPADSASLANPVTLDGPDIQAIMLDSKLEIRTEGRDMRHCADNYIDRYARGDWFMVSLRSSSCSRAWSTKALEVSAPVVKQVMIAGLCQDLDQPGGARVGLGLPTPVDGSTPSRQGQGVEGDSVDSRDEECAFSVRAKVAYRHRKLI